MIIKPLIILSTQRRIIKQETKIKLNIIPSRRTTMGKVRFMFWYALVIPFAMVAQFTIPPKIFTKIALT